METPKGQKPNKVSIASGGDTNIGGDLVGRDKVTHIHIYQGTPSQRPQPRNPFEKGSDFQIIDVAAIIDYSSAELEPYLGEPTEIVARGTGSAEELPQGGETRVYRIGKYMLDVNYDRAGIAKGIQIVEGLSETKYTLDHWPVILSRLRMTVINQPDIVAPAVRRWRNYNGYAIAVMADKPDRLVWSVRIYRNPA